MIATQCNIDARITETSFVLGDWPLSRVFLKDNANYPWFMLVPRLPNIREIAELPQALRYQLTDEISALSSIVKAYFKPDKLNVGALGNVVPELHVHVIGRYINDGLWPYGVWQEDADSVSYTEAARAPLCIELEREIMLAGFKLTNSKDIKDEYSSTVSKM